MYIYLYMIFNTSQEESSHWEPILLDFDQRLPVSITVQKSMSVVKKNFFLFSTFLQLIFICMIYNQKKQTFYNKYIFSCFAFEVQVGGNS